MKRIRRRQFKRMLEHVRVLRLEPGDVLILAYPEHLTMEMADLVKARLQREFSGHKAIVVDGGASFDVLRDKTGTQPPHSEPSTPRHLLRNEPGGPKCTPP